MLACLLLSGLRRLVGPRAHHLGSQPAVPAGPPAPGKTAAVVTASTARIRWRQSGSRMYHSLYGPQGPVIFDHPYNADTLDRSWRVHDVVSLGVSARRGPVLWSYVRDVRSRDCPFVAALLTFAGFRRNSVMDMSTTQSYRNH
jgi:hypothetical protein